MQVIQGFTLPNNAALKYRPSSGEDRLILTFNTLDIDHSQDGGAEFDITIDATLSCTGDNRLYKIQNSMFLGFAIRECRGTGSWKKKKHNNLNNGLHLNNNIHKIRHLNKPMFMDDSDHPNGNWVIVRDSLKQLTFQSTTNTWSVRGNIACYFASCTYAWLSHYKNNGFNEGPFIQDIRPIVCFKTISETIYPIRVFHEYPLTVEISE